MSTALAIAAVSACVRDLIHSHLTASGIDGILGAFKVTTRPPDRVLGTGAEDPTQVNWFLHRVSPNAGWSNRHLPERDPGGTRVDTPPLALNLHYVLSVFASRELHAEILLGHAMQALHEAPMLGRDAIRKSLSPSVPPPDFPAALALSGLAEQIEAIKFTLTPAADEIGRLWPAINSHYRTSAFYEASVVLIESRKSARPALQVSRRLIQIVTLNRPHIEAVANVAGAELPVSVSSTLRITGQGFKAEDTRVLLNGIDITSPATILTSGEILQPLLPVPQGLRSGLVGVRLLQRCNLGDPPTPHGAADSNVAGLVLHPEIVPGAPVVTSSEVIDGVTFKSGTIPITVNPCVDERQRVVLLLNEKNPPATRAARGYSMAAPEGNGIVPPGLEAGSVTFTFTRIAAGKYLARVSVDGAESLLTPGAGGSYSDPAVTI